MVIRDFTILIALALLFLLPNSFAQAAVEAPLKYVLCKNHKMVRTIRVDKDEDGSCKTQYTKSGEDRMVGFGVNDSTCTGFLKNIQSNLEQARWDCKDITSAKIFSAQSEN